IACRAVRTSVAFIQPSPLDAARALRRFSPGALSQGSKQRYSRVAGKPVCWYYGVMKTTLDLPDDLVRAVKIRAVEENRKLKDMVAELLRRGLEQEPPPAVRRRVRLPLVQCAHPARPEEEITPER